MDEAQIEISRAQVEQYRQNGYFAFQAAIGPQLLEGLQAACDGLVDEAESRIDEGGPPGANRSGRRFLFGGVHRSNEALASFAFGELMGRVCRALLGDRAFLWRDLLVAKRDEGAPRFAWHQESGYIAAAHPPFVNCLCALDDIDRKNGALYLLPLDRAADLGRVDHLGSGRGYEGDETGVRLDMPAGSVAVFSSMVFHRVGANTTGHLRRTFLLQYASEPLPGADGSEAGGYAVPFLDEGERLPPPPLEEEGGEEEETEEGDGEEEDLP